MNIVSQLVLNLSDQLYVTIVIKLATVNKLVMFNIFLFMFCRMGGGCG